jgi:hypothetical protein
MVNDQQKPVMMRCPVCLGREIDVLLLRTGAELYCVKCSFRGTESDVRIMYASHRQKYKNRTKRVRVEDL